MIRPHYVPLFQSVCHSEKLADLKVKDARFFYCALLTHCDSWGRCGARPRVLWSKAWSMFGSLESVAGLLDDLERVGLIRRYTVDGEPYLVIPDWEDKAGKVGQATRRAESLIPEPPEQPLATPRDPSQGLATPGPARARSEPNRTEPSREEPNPRARGADPSPPDWWASVFAEFPALDSPESHAAFVDLLSTRKKRRDKSWDADRLRRKLAEFDGHDAAGFVASVGETISNRWAGLFPPKRARLRPGVMDWLDNAKPPPRDVTVERTPA